MSTENLEAFDALMNLPDPELIVIDDLAAKTQLATPAACKICRGAGIDLTYTNDQPYGSHLKTVHPESFPPASATDEPTL